MSLRLPAPPVIRCPSAAIVRPSGSQAGAKNSDRGPRVTAVTARVSTSTTWMSIRDESRSASRRRFEEKAIRRPSGDQAGSRSAARPSVSRRRRAGRDVDQPEVADMVVGEARAVEHVVEPVDESVVGRRRHARLRVAVDAAAAVVVGAGGAVRGARRRPAASRRATTRTRPRRAAGRSAGEPRRRREAGAGPARCPRGPSDRVSARSAPPRPARGGPR